MAGRSQLILMTILFSFAAAEDAEVTPLEKVVTMLEDLQTEILVEGKAEAKTYDKFACFCKDMTMEKTDAINENSDLQTELEAEIAGGFTRRTKLDGTIVEVSNIIKEKDESLKAADEQRAKDHAEFKVAEDDCFVFKKELDWAVVELMAAEEGIDTSGMSLGLLPVRSMVEKVWDATDDESAQKALTELKVRSQLLKPQERRLVEGLIQMRSGAGQTKGHMGSVVKKVKELKPGMEDTLKRLRADEVQSKHMYQMVVQGLTDEKKAQDKILKQTQKESTANTDQLGANQAEYTLTSGTLTDDQAYLKELTENCNTKSKQWDQRSGARAAELTALTNALTIIKDRVASKVSDKTVRLIETKKGTSALQLDQSTDSYEDVLSAADEEADDSVGKPALNFLQVSSPRKKVLSLLQTSPGELQDIIRKQNRDRLLKRAQAESLEVDEQRPLQRQLEKELALSKIHDQEEQKSADFSNSLPHEDKLSSPEEAMKKNKFDATRKKVMNMLKKDSQVLHSHELAALAAQVSTTGVFDKITKLIQELIERLLQEAADEANHQGWCNKAMTEAKEQRSRKAQMVKDLNDRLSNSEAKRDTLQEAIDTLTAEIAELDSALAKQTKARNEETDENSVTIKEATDGEEAVSEALDMLDKFYKTQAKNTVFAQGSKAPEMPDAGFDDAYKGGQDAAKGILGMMEVIRDDFRRTIKVTTADEKEAAKQFMEFETETKMSLASKTNTKQAKEQELAETKVEIDEDNTSMVDEQKLLDKALQELIELQPACVPKVESYAERVAKREQEIQALKKALCTLDAEGPVQTESGDCATVEDGYR